MNLRLEKRGSSPGGRGFYLARDISVRNKRAKVSVYLGKVLPSPAEVQEICKQHTLDIETRVAIKKAQLSSIQFETGYFDLVTERMLIGDIELVKYLWLELNDVLREDELRAYEEQFEIQYVQGTTSIEGNTLSLNQARLVLQEGQVPAGKELREINEVQNFRLVKRLRESYEGKVTIDFVKRVHRQVMSNIDVESAGEFRRIDSIGIAGRDFLLTPAIEIEGELRSIINEYYSRIAQGYYPFFEAMVFHHRFESIHPFTDGNGRVGREILNYLLMREEYPRLLFLGKDRGRYLEALMKGDDGDVPGLVRDMAALIIEQRLKVAQENLGQLEKVALEVDVTLRVPASSVNEDRTGLWAPYVRAGEKGEL